MPRRKPKRTTRPPTHRFGHFVIPKGARVTDWKIHVYLDPDINECRRRVPQKGTNATKSETQERPNAR